MGAMRDAPYQAEHAGSLARKARPPRDLLGWFMDAFRAEVPAAMHGGHVFVGTPDRPGRETLWSSQSRPAELVGGSVLGAPQYADTFRRFVEDGPFAVEVAEYEGHRDPVAHYVFPLRAAIATLAGRGPDTDPFPFMARTLFRTGLRDGDWDSACASMGIIAPVRRIYIHDALGRVWARFAIEPPARTIRESSAA